MASDVSESLRLRVAQRANQCCEYCLIHEDDSGYRHQVDHIISRKHRGPTNLGNLAYACLPCNRFKGSDIASVDGATGAVVRLFNPRADRWTDHFEIAGALIVAKTNLAAATMQLLRLNAQERVEERRILQSLLRYPT